MTISYEVDSERHRLITVWMGSVTLEEALRHIKNRAAEGTICFPQLIDARKARVAFSTADVNRIVSAMKIHAQEKTLPPTAIVAGCELDFGMFRMFGSLADDAYLVNVFRSCEAARQWLGWEDDCRIDVAGPTLHRHDAIKRFS